MKLSSPNYNPLLKRLIFIARYFITIVLIFITQKVVFMLCNLSHADSITAIEWGKVLAHGLRLDITTAAYLSIVPTIIMVITSFFKHSKPRRILSIYYLFSSILMALVFVADTVLYLFWGAKMDANDLIYASKPKEMLASVAWWQAALMIIIVAVVSIHYFRRQQHATPKEITGHQPYITMLAWLPVLGLMFLAMRGGISQSTANASYAYFSNKQFLNHAALNPLFNMAHSLSKNEDFANEFKFYDEAEVNEVTSYLYFSDGSISDTLLKIERPNILMIIWESGGHDMVMNDSVGKNLMQWKANGIYFSQCYAANFRTDRGLVSLLSGWPGLPTTTLMKMPNKCRNIPGLAETLRKEGYSSRFTYGGDIDFTNMRLFLLETGFDIVYGSEAFPESRKLSRWGAPDSYVLSTGLTNIQHPFFSAVLTLSSHEPWDTPNRNLQDARQNAFAYTDSCINVLLQSLKESPLWDSLLVIITPDHGVPQASQSTSTPSVSHIPLILLGGAVNAPREIDVMMSQCDIIATLLAQMNISGNEYRWSRNILSQSYAQRPHFAIHAYKNGLNYIDSTGVYGYDCIDKRLYKSSNDSLSGAVEERIQKLLQAYYQASAQL